MAVTVVPQHKMITKLSWTLLFTMAKMLIPVYLWLVYWIEMHNVERLFHEQWMRLATNFNENYFISKYSDAKWRESEKMPWHAESWQFWFKPRRTLLKFMGKKRSSFHLGICVYALIHSRTTTLSCLHSHFVRPNIWFNKLYICPCLTHKWWQIMVAVTTKAM